MYKAVNKLENLIVKRGDVFYADLVGDGCVQSGLRPVIIISNDMNNKYSPTVQIIPLTTKNKKRNLPVHVGIDAIEGVLTRNSQALVEQLQVVNKSILVSKKGSLPREVIRSIEQAICIQLGFAA